MYGGLDYQQTVKDIWTKWERLVGIDLVSFVDEEPTTGEYFKYVDDGREKHVILQVSEDGFLEQGRIEVTQNYDTTNVKSHFLKIVGHEIGHALCIGHSLDPDHLMIGWRAPREWPPKEEEVWLIRVMYRMSRGVMLERYELN